MRTIMHFWRALVIAAVVLVAAAFSRTVQPIRYSWRTISNSDGGGGESESSIQYGSRHTAAAGGHDSADYDALAMPLSTHPSVLAHHYYDPPTEATYSSSWSHENVTFPAAAAVAVVASTPPTTGTAMATTKVKKSHKKNDYVPRVSYIRKPESAAGYSSTTAIPQTAAHSQMTTTKSIVPSVRMRKKGRWLKVRNEIPVQENQYGAEPTASSVPETEAPTPNIEVNRTRAVNHLNHHNMYSSATNASDGGRRLAVGSGSRFTPNTLKAGSLRRHRERLGFDVEASADANRSASADSQAVKHAAARLRWNSTRHGTATTTTEDPVLILRSANGRLAPAAQRLKSAYPYENLRPDTTEPYSTEKEELYDYATQEPTDRSTYNTPPAGTPVDHQPPLVLPRNGTYLRKSNMTGGKTTPMPKYKQAYLRKPNGRVKTATVNPFDPSHNAAPLLAGASNHRHETETIKYDESPTWTIATDQPYFNSDPEASSNPSNPSDAGAEVAIEPGTHHESLKYSDTEKTEEIFHDTEYPEEDAEESEADEEVKDSAATDESPSKILQKPIRFAYSSDQNISESQQEHKEPAEKEKEGGGEKHKSAHHKSEGGKAEEEYESAVEYDKGKKGHSDKENRKHHHEEEGGKKNKHRDESGHHASHHVAAKGEKGTAFGESGNHKKGHSTKGSHNIHKKNEYLKKHEFYDEHHEDDEHKNYGDFHKGHKYKKGNNYKKKHKDGDYSEGHSGKMGKKHHGHRFRQHKGHNDAFKHVDHYGNSEDYGEKGHHSEGKKWKYEML